MTATLNEDVFCNFNSQKKDRTPYGKKGDIVKIISQSWPAYIVEGPTGEKFPVNADRLIIKK